MPHSTPAPGKSETLETARRRVRYRASHRGTKELDIILGGFADTHIATFDAEMLKRFENLLENEEVLLQHWLLGEGKIPGDVDGELIERIRTFQQRRAATLSKEPSR